MKLVNIPGRVLLRVPRPGRYAVGPDAYVGREHVETWLRDVRTALGAAAPTPADESGVGYVCLLGAKRDGRREIADFYDARGPRDGSDMATLAKQTWGTYLNTLARGELRVVVRHVPTIDDEAIPAPAVEEAIGAVHEFWDARLPVLIGCSAARVRTGQVVDELLRRLSRGSPC